MRARHALPIVWVALLLLCASAGADEVLPPEPSPEPPPAAAEPVVAPPVEAPAPTPTPPSQATPAPAPTPPSQATPAATPQATPAPTPQAAVTAEAAQPPQATPAPIPQAAATAAAAQPPPAAPAPVPPSGCATPVEFAVGDECRVPASVCTIFGTDGDNLLPGTPLDDILCGFGGDDQLEGGDGGDVLFGGDGDDVLVGGEGGDCMVGGPGTDSADTTPGEMAEVERSADNEPSNIGTFDAEGRCTAGAKGPVHVPRQTPPRIVGVTRSEGILAPMARVLVPPPVIAPAGAAPVPGLAVVGASSSEAGRVRLRLPRGARAVRRGVVRLRVSCSAYAPGELVLLAGSRRLAHKRFACRPPGRTVRVRLNAAGRRLLARDDRVRARMLVLAAGRTVSRRVLLVSPPG